MIGQRPPAKPPRGETHGFIVKYYDPPSQGEHNSSLVGWASMVICPVINHAQCKHYASIYIIIIHKLYLLPQGFGERWQILMPNITTSILVFSFAYECVHTYFCKRVFVILCLYFVHIAIDYECIVFRCIVEINLLTLHLVYIYIAIY